MKKQTLAEQVSRIKGMIKSVNEQLFNDEGEQMMSYRQYQDYNKPLERDYEDMYNDEEEDDNDNDYYIDAPIGRRLKDGTMVKFRDDDDVEFGGEILSMKHDDGDEPYYNILRHGDRYDTKRYPHEVKIDRSYSPRLSEQEGVHTDDEKESYQEFDISQDRKDTIVMRVLLNMLSKGLYGVEDIMRLVTKDRHLSDESKNYILKGDNN
jgi:hypothetical protein